MRTFLDIQPCFTPADIVMFLNLGGHVPIYFYNEESITKVTITLVTVISM